MRVLGGIGIKRWCICSAKSDDDKDIRHAHLEYSNEEDCKSHDDRGKNRSDWPGASQSEP